MLIFRRIFLNNCWWQKSDIWSQASIPVIMSSYTKQDELWANAHLRIPPLFGKQEVGIWRVYCLFANLVGFSTHWTYMHIFLSNYWCQRSDIWSQTSYRYPISWEAFLDPSDSYFLFADFVDLNCELMLTYDTPALRQTGSRNLTGQKTLPTIWGTYMKLVTKYQISAINSCWEKCD
jgi:hypothetical protein